MGVYYLLVILETVNSHNSKMLKGLMQLPIADYLKTKLH